MQARQRSPIMASVGALQGNNTMLEPDITAAAFAKFVVDKSLTIPAALYVANGKALNAGL